MILCDRKQGLSRICITKGERERGEVLSFKFGVLNKELSLTQNSKFKTQNSKFKTPENCL
jgi:hypothetical protein